ncbi:hypothetical protein O4H49_19980 [Kiloniella laminariae]|uniref:Sulfotransferase domain-containing protein n=1 Tax=Kiloniella laminariae TaxID=454162 RepID=A0ABT4LPM0_9PROT|nr:hypothetical protein [Kiloniella laminariae]MCZ4283074.1 hypothetical protein [Kiloniella laminariae]
MSFNIFVHKTGAMTEISRYVSRGYSFYISGFIPAEKLHHFHDKISERYNFNLTKYQKAYQKRKGNYNSHFITYPRYNSLGFNWIILFTHDLSEVDKTENFYSIKSKNQRLMFTDRFELIELPRKGNDTSWTWRIANDYYQNLKQEISDSIRLKSKDNKLEIVLNSIHRLPGFRGIRNQIFQLRKFALVEYERNNSKPYENIKRKYIPFTRFQKFPVVNSELVVERILKGKTPFKNEWKYPENKLISMEKL